MVLGCRDWSSYWSQIIAGVGGWSSADGTRVWYEVAGVAEASSVFRFRIRVGYEFYEVSRVGEDSTGLGGGSRGSSSSSSSSVVVVVVVVVVVAAVVLVILTNRLLTHKPQTLNVSAAQILKLALASSDIAIGNMLVNIDVVSFPCFPIPATTSTIPKPAPADYKLIIYYIYVYTYIEY